MITVVIIGILATAAIVKYGPVTEKGYSAEAYSALAQIVSAENSYRADYNTYTTSLGNLDLGDGATAVTADTFSQNFRYTISSTVLSAYARADNVKSGSKATKDYYMCLNGGKKSVNVAPSCP